MLDVYRKVYKFTDEPFRLGPDHRYSLHHASYSNAKAYLEYAIFQGEGFVMVTGRPGTGKTTLITEMLSLIDQNKIEVSTLTSTQLESRDLLHMVALSFGIDTEDSSKAGLLQSIEEFLIRKIRSGHRAVLIVDEAQGLSPGCVEELRLLANLQFQHHLLLQIVLMGQEDLKDLVQQPSMEHLRQRLVAATSLEPLGHEDTVKYVEHRLGRVAWSGNPAIAPEALKLVYCYSGGIPRRINLIMNRLFLYGGMDEKELFEEADAREVVTGLIEEFLLPDEPLVAEAEVDLSSTSEYLGLPREVPQTESAPGYVADEIVSGEPEFSGGVKSAVSLSTPDGEPGQADSAAAGTEVRGLDTGTGQATNSNGLHKNPRILSPRTTDGRKRAVVGTDMDVGSARRARKDPPDGETEGTVSQLTEKSVRHKSTSADLPGDQLGQESSTRAGSKKKGLLIVLVLLASAGSAFMLNYQADNRVGTVVPVAGDTQIVRSAGGTDSLNSGGLDSRISTASSSDKNGLPEQEFKTSGGEIESKMEPGVMVGQSAETNQNAVTKKNPESTQIDRDNDGVDQLYQSASLSISQERTALKLDDDSEHPADEESSESGPLDLETQLAKTQVAGQGTIAPGSSESVSPSVENVSEQPPAVTGREVDRRIPAVNMSTAPSDAVVEARRHQLRLAAERRLRDKEALLASVRVAPRPALSPVEEQVNIPVQNETKATRSVKKKRPGKATEVKQSLLAGRWSSSGKPASLLPSASTTCHDRVSQVDCTSAPQNVNTQYGVALYTVQTAMTGFSADGHFELTYRTLVRLVDGDSGRSNKNEHDWQVTEYSMSCALNSPNQVSCLDGKGISRKYQRDSH